MVAKSFWSEPNSLNLQNLPLETSPMVPAKDNPFSVDRVLRIRYRLETCTWDELLDRIQLLGWRAAIVGPHGSGKTTLLEDLRPHLESRGFEVVAVRLNREPRRLAGLLVGPQNMGLQRPGSNQIETVGWTRFVVEVLSTAGPTHVVCLDGAEQLGRWRWRQVLKSTRQCRGLLVTTHRPGKLPTLWRCRTSPDLAAELVAELLPDRRDEVVAQVKLLFRQHDGNLREVFRTLYDRVARTP